ncbi:MAG: CPXCG motif-containing cysteine-rich protein [Planctomyces sp.]|jgi:hypothetical protein|nr:CPXCG motif-containing cysteine-rich protein [Planctomyces sp.]
MDVQELSEVLELESPRPRKRKRRPRTSTPEGGYVCHSCGEEIIVPIDLSQGSEQEYVEDCPVCCSPNVITVEIEPDGQFRVDARPE